MKRDDLGRLVGRLRVRLETDRRFGVDRVPRFTLPDGPETGGASAPAGEDVSGGGADALSRLAAEVASCRDCVLSETRQNAVFGEGHPHADLMFVGEAPGAEEDRQGKPFVGRAGALLTKIIHAMGLTRGEVYIGNILKCRPPNNRDPSSSEVEACRPHLVKQIELIDPQVLVALGGHALRGLMGPGFRGGITAHRGTFKDCFGRRLMPTFHPAYLLRNEGEKRKVWEDMKKVLEALGRTPPPRRISRS